ncbi:MAG: CHAT domain-containing protein, partial [Pseudanabaena sp.]
LLAGTSLLNKEFTVSNLQAQRLQNDYGIVHLATHGKFVSDNANDSFIQFWDSQLTLERIPRLRFDSPVVEMLTLSACETSVGNNLGISGLAVDSGARSVLASLWAISDAGTAPLMINFYKLFPEAKTKALALQQAQRSLIDGSLRIENNKIIGIQGIPPISLNNNVGKLDLRHPFFWAPFVLIGNWL